MSNSSTDDTWLRGRRGHMEHHRGLHTSQRHPSHPAPVPAANEKVRLSFIRTSSRLPYSPRDSKGQAPGATPERQGYPAQQQQQDQREVHLGWESPQGLRQPGAGPAHPPSGMLPTGHGAAVNEAVPPPATTLPTTPRVRKSCWDDEPAAASTRGAPITTAKECRQKRSHAPGRGHPRSRSPSPHRMCRLSFELSAQHSRAALHGPMRQSQRGASTAVTATWACGMEVEELVTLAEEAVVVSPAAAGLPSAPKGGEAEAVLPASPSREHCCECSHSLLHDHIPMPPKPSAPPRGEKTLRPSKSLLTHAEGAVVGQTLVHAGRQWWAEACGQAKGQAEGPLETAKVWFWDAEEERVVRGSACSVLRRLRGGAALGQRPGGRRANAAPKCKQVTGLSPLLAARPGSPAWRLVTSEHLCVGQVLGQDLQEQQVGQENEVEDWKGNPRKRRPRFKASELLRGFSGNSTAGAPPPPVTKGRRSRWESAVPPAVKAPAEATPPLPLSSGGRQMQATAQAACSLHLPPGFDGWDLSESEFGVVASYTVPFVDV